MVCKSLCFCVRSSSSKIFSNFVCQILGSFAHRHPKFFSKIPSAKSLFHLCSLVHRNPKFFSNFACQILPPVSLLLLQFKISLYIFYNNNCYVIISSIFIRKFY
jgi:hypothetical protein